MTALDAPMLTRLLGSIEANRLVFLCGAGLSMPAPSSLMSAARVAQACYDKWAPTETLPVAMRDDVDQLAGHFYAAGLFEKIFISALVPWDDLVGEPNAGHAAIADLLISRAASATLSANFDPLIEQWAERRKVAMQGALDGVEAQHFSTTSNPLLKFHGCLHRGRTQTLWTQGQVAEPTVAARINSCSQWMNLNLPGKDLLIVGFWTDWGYLNDVLANVISLNNVSSVTLIDPMDAAQLAAKAPNLWGKLTGSGAPFGHVQASGDVVLDELRTAFSKVWARKFFVLSKPFFEAEGGVYDPAAAEPVGWGTDDFYNLRRDSEGVPYNRAAKKKEPGAESAAAAFAHILLLNAGATRKGPWYEHDGKTIRIVQGAGQPLETVKGRYKEPPSTPQADIVVCAGSEDVTIPSALIAAGHGASVVRSAPGGGSKWLTLEQARAELNL